MHLRQRVPGPFTEYDWAAGPNWNSPQARGLDRGAWWPTVASTRGETLRDLARNKYPGTLATGMIWVSDGPKGSALDFPGTATGYVSLGDLSAIAMPWSFCAWVLWDVYGYETNQETRIFVSGPNTILMDTSGGLRLYAGTALVASPSDLGGGIVTNAWYHVCVVLNGAASAIYLNGISRKTGNIGSGALQTTSWLGITGPPYAQVPHNGRMTDIRIRPVALTAAEVFHEFAYPWDLYPPALIQWYPGVTDAALYHSIFGVGPSPLESVIIGRLPHGQA